MGGYEMILSIVYIASIIVLFLLFVHNLRRMFKADKEECKKRESEKRRKEAEESERQRKEAYRNKMLGIVRYMNEHVDAIYNLFSQIINASSIANKSIVMAGDEFSGGYYAPFWDQIEITTNKLALCNDIVRQINGHLNDYWLGAKDLDSEFTDQVKPCVLPGKLPDIQSLADSLSKLVRRSQRDINFSTIYEQRKTNTLLYHGFRNLGDAIYSLGDRITDSINELSHNLNSSLDDIISTTNENSRVISDNILEQTDRINEHAKAQRKYESDSLKKLHDQQKTLEQQKRVLDSQNRRINNIQRGRKPGLFDE